MTHAPTPQVRSGAWSWREALRRVRPPEPTAAVTRLRWLIAATALAHGFTMVTRNVADFQPMGVTLLNPWDCG